MLDQFIKSYWNYYLELEDQLLHTKKYVEFSRNNNKAFSIEYLKLYQAVCSEIDVIGKDIAKKSNPSFIIDSNSNIKKWGFEVQQLFPAIKDTIVEFNKEELLQPFIHWEYERYTKSNGHNDLRRANNSRNFISWWKNYTNVKHQRIGLITGTKNYELANQRNLILAFAALYILEKLFMNYLSNEENIVLKIKDSELFSIQS